MGLRTVEQLRGARSMLGWTQKELAESAGVSVPTIKRLEGGSGVLSVRLDTLEAIQAALINAGIQFIPQNGGGPGVRMRDKT